jgi:hypothetical protein
MYDSIISLKGEIWAHKPSLILPPFIEVPVPSHEMVCAISIDVVSFSNSSSGFYSDSGLVFFCRCEYISYNKYDSGLYMVISDYNIYIIKINGFS